MQVLVTLKNISISKHNHSILNDISLTITNGKITTLIGPNGAGKSTLVKIIIGLIKPNCGTITRAKNLTIGYVPQKIKLDSTLPITVSRFIRLNKNIDHNDVLKALKQVKASKLINRSMQQLSGGEMQRVLFAQALAKKPQLLILDEPTQGVDINGQIELYDLIVSIKNELNCGILMASHDLHIVMAKTDNVICLNQHICCSGTPAIVSNDPQFLALFGHSTANQFAFYEHHHKHQYCSHQYQGSVSLPELGKSL